MNFTAAMMKPFPLWVALVERDREIDSINEVEVEMALGLVGSAFRSVSVDRLPAVLARGVDVEPTHAPMYVSHFLSKALEYGGLPKVVLAFDPDALDPTFREIPASTPEDEVRALAETFPSRRVSADGTKLWLTRLDSDDPRAASPYEWEYARWIPGNPLEAIRAVLLFARPSDLPQIQEALQSRIDAT